QPAGGENVLRVEVECAPVVARRRVPFLLVLRDDAETELRPGIAGLEDDRGRELLLGVRVLAGGERGVSQNAVRLPALRVGLGRLLGERGGGGEIVGRESLVGGFEQRAGESG